VAEQRYQAVLAVIGGGGTVSEGAGRWGVSRQSVHAWLARYEAAAWRGWWTGRTGRAAARMRWIRGLDAARPLAGLVATGLEVPQVLPSGDLSLLQFEAAPAPSLA